MTIPSSWSLIFEVKSTWSELVFIRVLRLQTSSEDFGGIRKTSDFFERLQTSSEIFGNDRVFFKNPSTPGIKVSRLYRRKVGRYNFLNSETKEPTKLLSSSAMRGGKFISEQLFCSRTCFVLKQANFKFQSYGSAWHKAMNMFVEKYILSSGFLAFLKVKVLGKVLITVFAWSVQIISGLDSQSKLQMLTLFSCRHVGVPWRYTDMVAPYWAR